LTFGEMNSKCYLVNSHKGTYLPMERKTVDLQTKNLAFIFRGLYFCFPMSEKNCNGLQEMMIEKIR